MTAPTTKRPRSVMQTVADLAFGSRAWTSSAPAASAPGAPFLVDSYPPRKPSSRADSSTRCSRNCDRWGCGDRHPPVPSDDPWVANTLAEPSDFQADDRHPSHAADATLRAGARPQRLPADVTSPGSKASSTRRRHRGRPSDATARASDAPSTRRGRQVCRRPAYEGLSTPASDSARCRCECRIEKIVAERDLRRKPAPTSPKGPLHSTGDARAAAGAALALSSWSTALERDLAHAPRSRRSSS
jgi:hypothetical protein